MKKYIIFCLGLIFLFSQASFSLAETKPATKPVTKSTSKNTSKKPSKKPKIKIIKKEIEYETPDFRIIKATLTYKKTENKKLPTIVLLHSLGYNSTYWKPLTESLNLEGYAVLAIDLRGHGNSVYTVSYKQRHWSYFNLKTFAKYPSDVIGVINETQKLYKKPDFNNYMIIGADIGANTGVLVAQKYNKKPKALVLISAAKTFKGLSIPIAMTEIGTIPILSIASIQDNYMISEQIKLAKFSQGVFYIKNYPYGGTGMLLLKTNPSMKTDITNWVDMVMKGKPEPKSKTPQK